MKKSLRIRLLLSVLAVASSVCASAQTASGSISGVVYGPDGSPLPHATVWANIVSPVAAPVDRDSSIPLYRAVSAINGAFVLSNVPSGEYALCASNPAVAGLNPCGWGSVAPVTVQGGPVGGQSIHLAPAAVIQVHISDAAGLLAPNAAAHGAPLIVGLVTPQGFRPFAIAGATATSRDYRMLVPFNTPLNFLVSSPAVRLSASAAHATPFSVGQPTPITVPSATPSLTINLQVIGAN